MCVICLLVTDTEKQQLINTCHRQTSSQALPRVHARTLGPPKMIDWPPHHHKGSARTRMFTVTHRCSDSLHWHPVRTHLHNTSDFTHWTDVVRTCFIQTQWTREDSVSVLTDERQTLNASVTITVSFYIQCFILTVICTDWEELKNNNKRHVLPKRLEPKLKVNAILNLHLRNQCSTWFFIPNLVFL